MGKKKKKYREELGGIGNVGESGGLVKKIYSSKDLKELRKLTKCISRRNCKEAHVAEVGCEKEKHRK